MKSYGVVWIGGVAGPVIECVLIGGRLFVNIEDENRSSVRVDLSREISEGLRALVRYTLYANELGSSGGSYRRHTLLLSLAFTFDK